MAHVGLYFWGPRTNGYVRTTLSLAGLAMVRLLTTLVWTAVTGLRLEGLICLVITVFLTFLAVAAFGRRSIKTDAALAAEHFHRDGTATLLADVNRIITHVFCATELQEGRHFYMSPGFVYSWANGVGVPSSLLLSTAVQAPRLPGAFAARRLPTRSFAFRGGSAGTPLHDDLVFVDGGVYDNMAEQWQRGLAARVCGIRDLPEQLPVDEIIVVNASALPGFRLARMKRPA